MMAWSSDPERRIVYLEKILAERSGVYPFGPRGPQVIEGQGIYTLLWRDPRAMVELDFIGTDSHSETHAEIEVSWEDPADPLAVVRTHVTLSSLTGRDRLVTALRKRADGYDWQAMLDQAARWALERYRRGDPGQLLRDAEELAPGSDALTDPPLLESDGLSLLFGDGGSLKSWIALALAASLQAGCSYVDGLTVPASRRVGYLDWEWSARHHRRRLVELAGPDLPDLAYLRCSRSLDDERDRIRRFVRDFGLDYLIVDSVGLACGGEPESAEVATRFVNGLASLVPASLGIAHVTKAAADKAPDKPFGSAYWHNSARRSWYVRMSSQVASGRATVGLYNRKVNDGPRAESFALDFGWADGRVTIAKGDVRDVPELDATRSIPARLRDLLARSGAMELHAIAGELSEKIDSVKQAAYRGKRDGLLVNFPGPDGVYRWALKAREG